MYDFIHYIEPLTFFELLWVFLCSVHWVGLALRHWSLYRHWRFSFPHSAKIVVICPPTFPLPLMSVLSLVRCGFLSSCLVLWVYIPFIHLVLSLWDLRREQKLMCVLNLPCLTGGTDEWLSLPTTNESINCCLEMEGREEEKETGEGDS